MAAGFAAAAGHGFHDSAVTAVNDIEAGFREGFAELEGLDAHGKSAEARFARK